ncbi:MAG: O-linked N-acetylglucosamine transferase family protein [Sulfuricaulis sp.]
MALNYIPRYDAATVYREHLNFARRFETPLIVTIRPPINDRSYDKRLRVGYVSSDFRQHAVANYVEPVLRHYDRDRFQVFCYSNHEREDEVTCRIQTYIDCWRSVVHLSDEQAARQIMGDKIDILVDLNGHTGHNRLLVFARKTCAYTSRVAGVSEYHGYVLNGLPYH